MQFQKIDAWLVRNVVLMVSVFGYAAFVVITIAQPFRVLTYLWPYSFLVWVSRWAEPSNPKVHIVVSLVGLVAVIPWALVFQRALAMSWARSSGARVAVLILLLAVWWSPFWALGLTVIWPRWLAVILVLVVLGCLGYSASSRPSWQVNRIGLSATILSSLAWCLPLMVLSAICHALARWLDWGNRG